MIKRLIWFLPTVFLVAYWSASSAADLPPDWETHIIDPAIAKDADRYSRFKDCGRFEITLPPHSTLEPPLFFVRSVSYFESYTYRIDTISLSCESSRGDYALYWDIVFDENKKEWVKLNAESLEPENRPIIEQDLGPDYTGYVILSPLSHDPVKLNTPSDRAWFYARNLDMVRHYPARNLRLMTQVHLVYEDTLETSDYDQYKTIMKSIRLLD